MHKLITEFTWFVGVTPLLYGVGEKYETNTLLFVGVVVSVDWHVKLWTRLRAASTVRSYFDSRRGRLGEPTGHTLLNHTSHWQYVLPRVGWCGVGPWVSRVESKRSLFGAAEKKGCRKFSLCKLHGRNTSQLGAVSMLSYFTMINTYHSDHERKLHYEGGIFTQKLCFVLKIFTSEGSNSKSWFKSGDPESRGGKVSISRSIQW